MNQPEIDFARLYRERMARAGRPERPPEYWDNRAESLGERMFTSPYVRQFIDRMNLEGCATLLDVGCGPGAIALAAAPRMQHVYGLDYSARMLEALLEHARSRGLETAVTAIRRSWSDDWSDVPVCDVVVASRSTAVPDLEAAVLKLNAVARRRVYITYPADGHFVGDSVCQAIGRPDRAIPDYLYAVGILHNLRLYPTLDYLPGENRFARCASYDEFRVKVLDILGDVNADEEARLRRYWGEHQDRIRQEPMRWALLSWETGA